jgi:hypothetical protein
MLQITLRMNRAHEPCHVAAELALDQTPEPLDAVELTGRGSHLHHCEMPLHELSVDHSQVGSVTIDDQHWLHVAWDDLRHDLVDERSEVSLVGRARDVEAWRLQSRAYRAVDSHSREPATGVRQDYPLIRLCPAPALSHVVVEGGLVQVHDGHPPLDVISQLQSELLSAVVNGLVVGTLRLRLDWAVADVEAQVEFAQYVGMHLQIKLLAN